MEGGGGKGAGAGAGGWTECIWQERERLLSAISIGRRRGEARWRWVGRLGRVIRRKKGRGGDLRWRDRERKRGLSPRRDVFFTEV